MLVENVEWQALQNYESVYTLMAAILRRRTRMVAVLAAITIFYVLVVFVPKRPETLYGFEFVHSSYDWSSLSLQYPPSSITPLPEGVPRRMPRVQFDFQIDDSLDGQARQRVLDDRLARIRNATLKSWTAYREYAWLYDELEPLSAGSKDAYGGWAAEIFDTLDTLWIMGLKDEFYDGLAAAMKVDWGKTEGSQFNVFETTIRHLGGLLAAYDLSKEAVLVEKAVELGDMLYMAFDTPNRMPVFMMDFSDAKSGNQKSGFRVPSSAVTSAGLEFTRLAQLTGNAKYYDAIDRVAQVLDAWQTNTSLPGMWPTHFNMHDLDLAADTSYTLGALADSLYEYLPKVHLITGGLVPMYEKMYRDSMDVVVKKLLFRPMVPGTPDIVFPGSAYASRADAVDLTPEMQHLTCFAGGMFGLGGRIFGIPEHVEYGERIARACAWAYSAMPTGIMPESATLLPCDSLDACTFSEDQWSNLGDLSLPKGFQSMSDKRYILRPEAIESIFIMYRITGNQEYQEMAWDMYESIVKATETKYAFASINDVTASGVPEQDDSMETFWTGETLKYFYLIFSPPDLISLDEYVINTEAHPLLRPKP